jgi:aldehyde dehydrogenase (NAD+)
MRPDPLAMGAACADPRGPLPVSQPGRSLIGGVWTEAAPGPLLALADPATEHPLLHYKLAGAAEADAAVTAARAAFDGGWHSAPKPARLDILARLIEACRARREAFARAISFEMGAPIDFARDFQVDRAVEHLTTTLRAAEAAEDDAPLSPEAPAHRARWEPLGVAALITPWNWPLNQIALKAGAALAAGCALVLKPSERAPLSAALFAEAMAEALAEAGAPAGLFSMVLGDGPGAGAALAAHAGVDALSFTGSTRAGRAVAAAAAPTVKRLALELGGKSANLLFQDCDLATAVRQGLAHCFRNAGQSCNAATRMLVARPLYHDAVALAADIAAGTRVDAPWLAGRHLGPLASREQFHRVQGAIATALAEGARLVAGGPGRPDRLPCGFYARPTVFADVAPAMALWREEVFGPVLAITPFEDEDEAVRLANDSPYGLAAYVQTADLARADRVARRLRVGMVQVNGSSRAPDAPFGGLRQSGHGREGGLWGVRAFQDVKSISGAPAV